MKDCLFRKVSYYPTYLLLKTNITPTQVTWISVIFGLVSVPFFYFGIYKWTLIGTLILIISALLDHIDGSIARYKQIYSAKGYYLDEVGSFIFNSGFLLMLGFGGYNKTDNIIWLYLGIACLFSYLIYLVIIFHSKLRETNNIKKSSAAEKHPKVYKKYTLLAKLLPAHTDHMHYALVILAILGIAEWLVPYVAFAYSIRWLGKATYDYLHSYE